MRLIERMAQPAGRSRNFSRQSKEQQLVQQKSVRRYLEDILNHRLQPGAVGTSHAYQNWYPALSALSVTDNWPLVTDYLLHMEPRIDQLTMRALKSSEATQAMKELQQQMELPRLPQGLFVLHYETHLGIDDVLAALALSNGRIHLVPIV